MIKTHSVKVC